MSIPGYTIEKEVQKYLRYTAYQVKQENTNKQFIAFNYPTNNSANNELFNYQIQFLKENRSPYFLCQISDVRDENSNTILYENCPRNLFHYINECKEKNIKIPESVIVKIVVDLCKGLSDLHEQYITHGNICPELIFLTPSNEVKLCGFTPLLFSDHPHHISVKYCCPELLSKEPERTTACDVWSIGIIVYEMCSLSQLFKGFIDITDYVTNDFEIPSIPDEYSDKLSDLISDCLSIDSDERPTVEEILELFENN